MCGWGAASPLPPRHPSSGALLLLFSSGRLCCSLSPDLSACMAAEIHAGQVWERRLLHVGPFGCVSISLSSFFSAASILSSNINSLHAFVIDRSTRDSSWNIKNPHCRRLFAAFCVRSCGLLLRRGQVHCCRGRAAGRTNAQLRPTSV